MIKTNNIDEYAALMVLKSYCNSYVINNCDKCKITAVCDCMAVAPSSWEVKYENYEDTKENNKQ